MNIPINILALIFVLSFLIFFHEGGHYLIAKLFKFPVEVFSLGFGKRLFGFKRKETDYRVSLIPLGGYVKVVGLGPDESDVVSGTAEQAPVVPGSRWQRLLILLAGPGVNLVLAILLTAGAFMIGIEVAKYRTQPPVVSAVAKDSPAQKADIRVGDRIVALGGKAVATWEDVEIGLGVRPNETVRVGVERGGERLEKDVLVEAKGKYQVGYTGLMPDLPVVVSQVIGGEPASKAGLRKDDEIAAIAGRPTTYAEVVRDIQAAAEGFAKDAPGAIVLTVRRDGKTLEVPVVPRREGEVWKIGMAFTPKEETVLRRMGPVAAIQAAWKESLKQATLTFETVGRLFRGRASVRQLSGPIDIAKFSGEAARTGLAPLLGLMGMLSLQLGILNLLPIPLLDGGQIFITLLESAARRDFSLRVKERLLQAGFVFLVLLMVTVLYFDVVKNI